MPAARKIANSGFELTCYTCSRYDNEQGQRDHKHLGGAKIPYRFSTPEALLDDFWKDVEGWSQGTLISFQSPQLLFRVLTGKRWELLKMMTGAGPMSIREAARRLERDVKAVHSDVHALLDTGILQKTEAGRIEFPFDGVHVDFTLQVA